MKKLLTAALIFSSIFFAAPVLAQELDGSVQPTFNAADIVAPQFLRAKIIAIISEDSRETAGIIVQTQVVRGRLIDGDHQGEEVEVTNSDDSGAFRRADVGDTLVLAAIQEDEGLVYYVADHYRVPAMVLVLFLFFALAIGFGRKKGLTSLIGLALSIFILAAYVVPSITDGHDPVVTAIVGSALIVVLSMYISHGPGKRTAVAVAATAITLLVSGVLSMLFVRLTNLFGAGSEAAFYLQYGPASGIDLRGLLLAGIIIGTLGILDDVTTAQVAAVEEIHNADPTLSHKELYKRGLSVGREHIASLTNTLALIYAGASLPLFLIFGANRTQPLWVLMNGEPVAEEFVRTMVGSCGLILAVPIATWMAAVAYSPKTAERSA